MMAVINRTNKKGMLLLACLNIINESEYLNA